MHYKNVDFIKIPECYSVTNVANAASEAKLGQDTTKTNKTTRLPSIVTQPTSMMSGAHASAMQNAEETVQEQTSRTIDKHVLDEPISESELLNENETVDKMLKKVR